MMNTSDIDLKPMLKEEKDRSRDRARRERPSRFSETNRDRSTDRGRNSTKSSNCRVYVSNIPYEYRWQDLKDLFRSEVGDVQFVELFVDENDKSKGSGIVEFSDPQSVKKCLEVMQRFEIKGRKLVVKEDSGNMRDKHGQIIGGSGGRRGAKDDRSYGRDDRYGSQLSLSGRGGAGDMPDPKWANTYGLSANFLDSLRIELPLVNRVFVANLEYNVDKKKLKEVFRLAGRVLRVDMHFDKEGRSRGFALVEYDHPVEAVQAISMFHNQVLFDRPMTVRMDRATETFKLPEGLKGIGMGLGTNGEPLRDVSRNLPSNNSQENSGTGILGAVPSQALQVASALTGLNSVVGNNTLSNLTGGNQSVLQAANLSSLIGNGLGADLSSLVNPVGNSSQLNLGPSGGSTGNFGARNDNGPFSNNQTSSFSSNQPFVSTRNYQSYDNSKGGYNIGSGGGGGIGSGYNDRDVSSGFGSNVGPIKSQGNTKPGGFSNKVLVSNLPASASFKMLQDKFNEFGEVQYIEEKGNGSVLIIYGSDWQAERAIKNLDRARIDGRPIDARLCY